mmetsp:Transcript_25443/g.71474  ORF Transcript_25443/g.71474 Transcript_25443/m.71474 type:complete len:1715 (-) Transcript_25443:36-5180(-)
MAEVDALTAARRARQRRRKELQRHGQAVLRRVLGVALLSAAALLYGASSNYTSHKDKEFGSGAGMLYGVGVVALPGTIVGLYVAYGPGNAMSRSARGFAVLVVIPALGVLGIVLNLVLTQQMDRETRNFGVFFGSFAAVLAGLAIHLTWSLVAAANSSSRVPGAAAGWLGTWICVLIMAPLGVAGPLILFRKNGRVLHQWFGVVSPDDEEHSAKPPLQLLPALLVPCVALLVLVHPLVRVTVLRWPVFADGTVPSLRHAPSRCGCLRKPFDALDAILCSSFVIFAASCYYEEMSVPLRLAGASLALVTPWTAAGAARIGAFSGSTDAVWRRATSKFVAPGLVLGLIGLRLGRKSTWFGPLSRVCFGAAAVAALALAARLTVERADDATRVRRATAFAAIGIMPWWLCVVGEVDLQSPTLRGAFIAALPSILAGIRAARDTAPPPRRLDMLRALPHLLLVAIGSYVGIVLALSRLKAGGAGVLFATFVIAPFCTRVGLDTERKVRKYRGLTPRTWLLVVGITPALVIIILTLIRVFFTSTTLTDALQSLLEFKRNDLTDEVRAGCAWLFIAVPCTTVGWDTVEKAAERWRRTARAQLPDRPGYYDELLGSEDSRVHETQARRRWSTINAAIRAGAISQTDEVVETKLQSDYWDHDIKASEAAPAFGGMLCCLVLVPFGVLAPLFFLVDGPTVLLLNKSRLMGALVLAVFVFVTVLTTAANASMDRIKTEKKSKLAGHALRLALRANSVVADGNCARQLFDVRHHHVEMATAALRRRPDAGNARNGRPLTERQHSRVQDAADRALLDDLKRSELRYENVVDASQKALAEVSQPSTGLDALKLRRRNAHASYELLIREDRLLQDEGLYYWRPTEKDEHSMSIINLPVLIDTIAKQYAHDHLIAEAHARKRRKRQEQEEKHHTPRDVSLQIELPSCLKCARKKRDAPVHVEEKRVDPATLKLRNEARVAIDACEQLAEQEGLADQRRKRPWSASVLREAVTGALMGGLDDFLQPLVQLEERLVARARWGLLCDALPVLVERRWSLTPMPPKSTMKYRAALLPRAYKAYVPMTEDSWRTFLSDADVLENGIATLKAELVFAALAQKGEMDYRSFRQAMRQVAVALYPQLPEADALKLLGQKHVFPKVKLAPEREASDLLPYQPESDSPRLLELLKREGGVVRDPAKRKASVETLRRAISSQVIVNENDHCSELAAKAGSTYARKLDIARSACSEAREAVLKAVEKSNSDRRPKTPPEEVVVLSPEEALAKAEQEKKERQEKREKSYYWRLRKKLHDAWKARDEKDEAELELELMRIGVETRGDRPKDWSLISEKVVETLRVSADHERRRSNEFTESAVRFVWSVDNAFAVFDLLMEWFTFSSLGLKGAAGVAWGMERRCTFTKRGCNDVVEDSAPKGLLKLAANAPLLTVDSLRTMQLFWISCIFCCAVPLYLMPAIRQAREQTLGLGEGGKKLSPFSKAGLYFNGIKIVSAAVAPVMTTLFSAFVCDTCEPSPRYLSRMSVRCGSATHVVYLVCGLLAALAYYPLIAYLQPQLQFKSKSLDLKFEPTYLVLVAQTKLSLAVVVNFWSEDRSRRCGEGVTASQRLTQGAQQLGIAAVLCGFLAYRTLQSRPCIVAEFNVARFALLSAAALFLVASLICDGLQRGLSVGMDLARFISAGLWLLAVVVVGWVSRRRLRRIDEERLAAAKDDDDGEDPVLMT